MTNPIVIVDVTQQIAAAPSLLQNTGALLSQGGTLTAPGTQTLLTQPSDLTPILSGAHAISSATQSGGTATITTTAPHGFTVGDTLPLTIAGMTPAAYNGTVTVTVTGASTFTYIVFLSPGTATVLGVYTEEDVAELVAMATTFFAQGLSVSVYVLELGPGNATDGATYLNTWLIANPGIYYAFLVPREWDGNATFLSLMASYQNTTSKLYFYITSTLATWTIYTPLMKCANVLIEAPVYGVWQPNALTAVSWSGGIVNATTTSAHGVVPGNYFSIAGVTSSIITTGYNGTFLALTGTTGSTLVYALAVNPGTESVLGTLLPSYYASTGIPAAEFSQAAPFWTLLSTVPSAINKVASFSRRFVSGVTSFPPEGNSALLTTLKAANISVIGTGAQGGINRTLMLWGNYLDGRPINYWWSVDWMDINQSLNMSNAVINGSQTGPNPLYNNQAGITALEGVGASTIQTAISYGLALGNVAQTAYDAPTYAAALAAGTFAGQAAINAVPFTSYYASNEGQYRLGIYQGFSVTYTPLRGFDQITIYITVTDFVAGPG